VGPAKLEVGPVEPTGNENIRQVSRNVFVNETACEIMT